MGSFFGILVSAFILLDAFDAKHFGTRQEWEVVVGLVVLLGSLVVGIFEDK